MLIFRTRFASLFKVLVAWRPTGLICVEALAKFILKVADAKVKLTETTLEITIWKARMNLV